MARERIHFGIIGLGLMGREFCSALARWCHLLDDSPVPVLKGICNLHPGKRKWYTDNFPDLEIITSDYHDLLNSEKIDAIYCAVPHNLHEKIYTDVIHAKKHLLGEKPFGMDKRANELILEAARANPDVFVRCSSEFPFFPACQELIKWLETGKYGRLIEVRTGLHHSSDLDVTKPMNWKREVETNGEYGCMGDLGIHTLHIPYYMGWKPVNVYADLQKIAETRPDAKGNPVSCLTWDNAVLTTKCTDPRSGNDFTLTIETKRMAPGATNTWFIEIYGTEGSASFSTHNPKTFRSLVTNGREQGWTSTDTGSQSAIPSITGAIFEFGFSDAFQQMIGVFIRELSGKSLPGQFRNFTPEETGWSHELFTSALNSHNTGTRVKLTY